MKWVVLETNPKRDDYVAVVLTERSKKLQIEKEPHSIFSDGDKAMERARELRDLYGVKSIRVFHSDSQSIPAA